MFDVWELVAVSILLVLLVSLGMGIHSLAKVPNSNEKYHFGGFWLRICAYFIDCAILAAILYPTSYFIGYFIIGPSMADSYSLLEIEAVGYAAGYIYALITTWLYFAVTESSNLQATPGKKLLGLCVVNLEGKRIGFGRATGRHFGKILSYITLLVGYFMMNWKKQKQALHDMLAGCLVIRSSSPVLQHGFVVAERTVRVEPRMNSVSDNVTHYSGRGANNHAEKFRWYLAAAEKGDEFSQVKLGEMYLCGEGVAQNVREAVRWYTVAAETGNIDAQVKLAQMHQDGEGVLQNHAEAARWNLIAAKQGAPAAQAMLGFLYEQGLGVSQSYITAHMWYNIAATNGVELARQQRSDLAEKMKGEQVSEAQALAQRCLSSNYADC